MENPVNWVEGQGFDEEEDENEVQRQKYLDRQNEFYANTKKEPNKGKKRMQKNIGDEDNSD